MPRSKLSRYAVLCLFALGILTCAAALWCVPVAAADGGLAVKSLPPVGVAPLLPAEEAPAVPLVDMELRSVASQVIALVNVQRANYGLAPLVEHPSLDAAAQAHSQDMATNDFFSHTGSDGSNCVERARRSGYTGIWVGENIVANATSAAQAVSSWMASPSHRQGILNPYFQHAGAGYAYNANAQYRHYWTLDFGAMTYTPLPTQTPTSPAPPTPTRPPLPTRTPTPTRTFTRVPPPTHTWTHTPLPTHTPTSTPEVAKNNYRFTGWVRLVGSQEGIGDVPVLLYRWQRGLWVPLGERTTSPRGAFAFTYAGPDTRFALICESLAGYASASAQVVSLGQVTAPNRIDLDMTESVGEAEVVFYHHAPDWTPTHTATPADSPTPTRTATDTPLPTATPTLTATATGTPEPAMVTLQQGVDGYNGVQDTFIDTWFPNTDHEADRSLRVRSGDVRSILLRFDLSHIPTGAVVTEATLRLYTLGASNSSTLPVGLYRVEATWPSLVTPALIDENLVASAVLNQLDTWVSINITPLAQRWITAPDQNYGALLRGEGTTAVEYELTSSEYANETLRPALQLGYYVPDGSQNPPPATPTRSPTPPVQTVTPPTGGTLMLEPSCDTYIDAWAPTINASGGRTLDVRSGNVRSVLMRFQLDVPPGTRVQNATLELYVMGRSNERALPIEVFAIQRGWDCASVTWNQAGQGQNWGEAGIGSTATDRQAIPSARGTLSEIGTWISLDLTEVAGQWAADPSSNQGILIKGAGDVSVQYHFWSGDFANPNLRPRLLVTY